MVGDRVSVWRKVIDAGAADRVCDDIVRARDVPPRLRAALHVPRPSRSLTRRERDVLAGAAVGLQGPAIADDLGIALQTVKTHRRHAIARLNARNLTHAVALAIRGGMIP